MIEIWKDISGFNNRYEISSIGRVRRKAYQVIVFNKGKDRVFKRSSKLLSIHISRCGYLRVSLSENNKIKNLSVHRLVAEAFIENYSNKKTVNHKDGNKQNNNVENLEWSTHSENIIHSYATGLKSPTRGTQFKRAKLNDSKVIEIRDLRRNGVLYKDIADIYKIDRINVSRICNYTSWKHVK